MTSGIASGLNKLEFLNKQHRIGVRMHSTKTSSRSGKSVNLASMTDFLSLARNVTPRHLRKAFYPAMTLRAASRALSGMRKPEPQHSPGPLVVTGFFDEPSGIGRAATLTVRALREAGLAVTQLHLRPLLEQRRGQLPDDGGGAWILHCNPAEAARALAYVDSQEWRGRRRIGFWAWELPVAPPEWARISRLFHEIWVPSHFVADALRVGGVDVPLRVMPHPIWTEDCTHKRDRSRFGWSESEFVVLALGDMRSSATRKNLPGAIEMYKGAFRDNGRSRLVLRALGASTRQKQQLLGVTTRSDILLSGNPLGASEIGAMIASADVVLSPHRSEGFGLSLAEAMMAGVPALATGWSGNMDFMRQLPELLIGYSLVEVADQTGIYRAAHQRWAEPDKEDGVQKLRALSTSPSLRASLAGRGRASLLALADVWSPQSLAHSALGDVV